MTNLEIVVSEAIAAKIFTEDQVEGYLSEGDLPLKTFKAWHDAGFIVRRGQKARLQTKLWQPRKHKKDEKEDEDLKSRFVLVPAYLFTADQVAPIAE